MERVIRTAATAAALLVIVLPISTRANEHLELWPLRGHLYVVEDDFYTKENSIVYVGENSVTVIGATWTPDTAKRLVTEIRKISSAPITQVIDTNYHTDRASGNAYFKAIGTEIVATEMTREQMAGGWVDIVQFTRSIFPDYPALPLVLPDKTTLPTSPFRRDASAAFIWGHRTLRTAYSSSSQRKKCCTVIAFSRKNSAT